MALFFNLVHGGIESLTSSQPHVIMVGLDYRQDLSLANSIGTRIDASLVSKYN